MSDVIFIVVHYKTIKWTFLFASGFIERIAYS